MQGNSIPAKRLREHPQRFLQLLEAFYLFVGFFFSYGGAITSSFGVAGVTAATTPRSDGFCSDFTPWLEVQSCHSRFAIYITG